MNTATHPTTTPPSSVEVMGTERMLDMIYTFQRSGIDDIAIERCGHEEDTYDFPEGAIVNFSISEINFIAENVDLYADCPACKFEYLAEQCAA